MKAMQRKRMQEVMKRDRYKEPVIRLPSEGGHVLVSTGRQHWCALCGPRGLLHQVGHQRCNGAKRDKWLHKSLEATGELQQPEDHSRGHLRMMSGQVVWCDRCGAYGTHRGCGLAQPCPGHATMGAGGGKWQRLRLLRDGRHPKDKSWLGTPLPEASCSTASVSNVNTALTEVRTREAVVVKNQRLLPVPRLRPRG